MKNSILVLFLIFFINLNAQEKKVEGGLTWYTDLVKANEIAKASNKPIFALFTGSDWCVWCKKLQRDVFAKTAFTTWANKNVILVELDFPRFKTLSPELTQQNNSLQQTFQVQGFPTVWMFYLNKGEQAGSFNIDALGSLGYPQGAEMGKEEVKFIKDADAIFKKKNGK
jgi:thioredoxin-related protein